MCSSNLMRALSVMVVEKCTVHQSQKYPVLSATLKWVLPPSVPAIARVDSGGTTVAPSSSAVDSAATSSLDTGAVALGRLLVHKSRSEPSRSRYGGSEQSGPSLLLFVSWRLRASQ